MFKNYNDFLNESVELFGKKTFREVSSLIRKKFPSVEIKIKTQTKCYYDPQIDEMRIFNLSGYGEWLQLPVKSIDIKDGRTSIELAKFLQSLKVTAWTNYSEGYTWRTGVFILSDDSLKQVKKMERAELKKAELERQAEAKAESTRLEQEASRARYKRLYEMLMKVPMYTVFDIPEIGHLKLIQMNRHQVMWGTLGHFKVHDSSSKDDMDELEKIVKYIYTESYLKTKLTAGKYGL
jgi:muconolactone delta-isomerase